MDKISTVINVHHQTQLLEALGWDEELLDQLFSYLETSFTNFETKSPDLILIEVEEHFGAAAASVLKDLFIEQIKFIKSYGAGSYEH